ETRRDIKRFYNSLITNINILEKLEDVDVDDYLLFKLLIFKYSWIYNEFSNKKINNWLGNFMVLKLNYVGKLDFLENKQLSQLDEFTIYTVLNRLFPNVSPENLVTDGSNKINQRRYFPLYLNNNVYNESFSYSELLDSLNN